MTVKKMRELIPPMFPSDSFTLEEALAAVAKVQAEENARTSAQKRGRASTAKPGAGKLKRRDRGKGDEGP